MRLTPHSLPASGDLRKLIPLGIALSGLPNPRSIPSIGGVLLLRFRPGFLIMFSNTKPTELWRSSMQALVWTAPEKMEMQQQPDPTPTAG